MSLPPMTPEIREAGLRKAREARIARAAALERLRTGQVTLKAFLDSDDQVIRKTSVRSVLLKLPGIGPRTADAAIAEIGIAEGRKVGGLGSTQRAALIDRFAA